jgi:enoyl-CoA hydratase
MALVEVDVAGDGVAVVTLNRPDAMNALSKALRTELAQVMLDLDGRDDVRAVVLTGAGTRAFSAGLDLKELGSDSSAMGDTTGATPIGNPVKAIEQCGKPVIGAINGVAITGGFEVALACDVLIGSENARFADTHARVGIMPGWGLSQKLSRLIGIYRAKELSLSGNFLDAETAERWGLLNRVVPAGELLAVAKGLAADMASIDPAFSRAYKALINDGFGQDFAAALQLEMERSRAANRAVPPAEIERRRLAVQARGRSQK